MRIRNLPVAALLAAAAPVAVALASPLQIWADPGPAPASTTVIADECHNPIHSGALNPMKWPFCAGD